MPTIAYRTSRIFSKICTRQRRAGSRAGEKFYSRALSQSANNHHTRRKQNTKAKHLASTMVEGVGFFDLLSEEVSLRRQTSVEVKEADIDTAGAESLASTVDESRSEGEESLQMYNNMDSGVEMEFVSRKDEEKVETGMTEECKQDKRKTHSKEKFKGSMKKIMSVRLFSKRVKKTPKTVKAKDFKEKPLISITVPIVSEPDRTGPEQVHVPVKRASFWEQIKAGASKRKPKYTMDPTLQWSTQMSVSTVSDDSMQNEIVEVQVASLGELRMGLPVAGHEDEENEDDVDDLISTIVDEFDVDDVEEELEDMVYGCKRLDFPSSVEAAIAACVIDMDNAYGCRIDDICQSGYTLAENDLSNSIGEKKDPADASSDEESISGGSHELGPSQEDDKNASSSDDDIVSIEEETFEATLSTASFDDDSEYDDFKKALILLKNRAKSRGLSEDVLLEKIRTEQRRRDSLVDLMK